MSRIIRVVRAPKNPKPSEVGVFTIFNLEVKDGDVEKISDLFPLLHNREVEKIVGKMPDGDFHEVIFKNAIIDPQSRTIGAGCRKLGVDPEALKVSYRYYGDAFNGVYVNPNVEVCFTEEPRFETLKPFGERAPMETFNLLMMGDDELMRLSADCNLSLSLNQMRRIRDEQGKRNLPFVTDFMLDTYAIFWCDHCKHTWWQELGYLLTKLRRTTEEIGNPNVLSAFIDNAGVMDFYDDQAIAFGGETHNSPSRKWTFGGQITKAVGHDRDIYMTGLGAKPIWHLEMTTIGETTERKVYPVLENYVFPEAQVARETIAAVSKAGNTTGIPMALARMYSHPAFGIKPFAFGGTIGITTREAALKGLPQIGDLAVLVGNRTGNDGYHGGTAASLALNKVVNAADHVQIGDPFTQQKMMPAIIKIRDSGCNRADNDFGAGGFISAFGEMAEPKTLPWGSYVGGLLLNFALVPLKVAGLPYKIIGIGESQERFAFVIIPEKLSEFIAICELYELEWTVMGVFTGNQRLQIIWDENVREFDKDTPLSGEILLDMPFEAFEDCPLSEVKIVEPPKKPDVQFPEINLENIQQMAELVVGHFDNCNQSRAQRQYDSTVQGISVQGPLYGRHYNVGSHLAVSKPIYGKPYGLTASYCFAPWLFDADPEAGAFSSFLDAFITHVAAGVNPKDIGMVDNFYSPSKDPHAPWHVIRQVDILCELEKRTAPIYNGKDSNHGYATYDGQFIAIPPSINITAVGKIPDVSMLTLHQWTKPGNLLYSLGKRNNSLAGSTLVSALGISGGRVKTMPMDDVKSYAERIYGLAKQEKFASVVPVNRGGLILRLFEGVEASGLGVHAYHHPLTELFFESFGNILVEIEPDDSQILEDLFNDDEKLLVGVIVREPRIEIEGVHLNWGRLFESWNTRFEKEVYPNG